MDKLALFIQTYPVIDTVMAFALALAVTAVLLYAFIPVLRKAKLGQRILEIGPNWNKSKEGTPTMGGLFFIIAIVASVVLFLPSGFGRESRFIWISLAFAGVNALIGFIDDYVKLFRKRNKGLSAPSKLLLQLVAATAYIGVLAYMGVITTRINGIVFDFSFDAGLFTYVLYILAIVYYINGANFTDGIDGLAGSVNLVIVVMFFILSVYSEDARLGVASAAAAGGLVGFLIFNFYPAKVFMGDTGSLFLGGLTAALAIYCGCPTLLYIFGFVHVFEALSVVLQVGSYKLTGKRIFKMSPIHHHFEKCGWSELRIVGVFSLVTALLCALCCWLYVR